MYGISCAPIGRDIAPDPVALDRITGSERPVWPDGATAAGVERHSGGMEDPMAMDDAEAEMLGQQDSEHNEHARPRKRTRRACDKCSTSRTRCDGEW